MDPCVLSCGHFGKFVKKFFLWEGNVLALLAAIPRDLCIFVCTRPCFSHPTYDQVNKCKYNLEFLLMVSTELWED